MELSWAQGLNLRSLLSLLRNYGKSGLFEEGKLVHSYLLERGFEHSTYVANCLMDMYGNCGSLQDAKSMFYSISNPSGYSWNILIKIYRQRGDLVEARLTFDRMPLRDVVAWTAMIAAYVQNGSIDEGLKTFRLMMLEGVTPDSVTLLSVVDAYACLAILDEGHRIHFLILVAANEADATLSNALINMYGKCGSPCDARVVFERMPHHDTVSWNALMGALSQNLQCEESLSVFQRMQSEGIRPDEISFLCILDAYSSLLDFEHGKILHSIIIRMGYDRHVNLVSALVSMYARFSDPCEAMSVLLKFPERSTAAWNGMIAAFSQKSDQKEALRLFSKMQEQNVQPNDITFICVMDAFTHIGLLESQTVHHLIVYYGCEGRTAVGNSLVKVYGKCCCVKEARMIFDNMVLKDVLSWSVMVVALAQNGHDEDALDVFSGMLGADVQPDVVTLSCILDVCAGLAALERGQMIHATVLEYVCKDNLFVGNSLLDLYAKCGLLHDAMNVFGGMSHQDVVTWTAVIDMFYQAGYVIEAFDFLVQMQLEGIEPNEVTFMCILNMCSDEGWARCGMHLFAYMNKEYEMLVDGDHFVCMIDILSHAGQLDEAEALIKEMQCDKVALAWTCLLGACIVHQDIERGMRAAAHCFELDPGNFSPYVLLSNLYASVEM